ncbi:MAG: hypothetical protein IJ583_02135 [Firmicutes bacterium]|nr:hypothetical protein [Bacillota bacterium]
MQKLEILLDEEKIKQEDKYELADIYNGIDELFAEEGLPKMPTDANSKSIFYRDNGRNTDLGAIFSCVFYLRDQDWFMPYVKKWLYYNSDNGKTEDDFIIENILQLSKEVVIYD